MRHATLGDVAAAAGVSLKTVSRVVNESPDVSEATRTRIEGVIADLGYVPNAMAQSLRGAADRAVAVIVDSLNDPFFAEAAQAVEDAMSSRGYLVMVASSHRDLETETRIVEQMRRRRVAGLIFSPAGAEAPWASGAAMPIVAIDRTVPQVVSETIRVDDRSGAHDATRHLIVRGHRRIAYIGDPPDIEPARNRIAGYRAALTNASIAFDTRLLRSTLSPRDAADAVRDLIRLDDPPTAIFSASRLTTLGVIAALHSADRTDVAMVGFGDFAMAEALRPAITVVTHDARQLGRRAAASLLGSFSGEAVTDPAILPLRIIERGSGELTPSSRHPRAT